MNKRLVHEKENAYFILALILSISTYLALILSIIGILYILLGMAVTFFMHGLVMAHIRTNGVKITAIQFPDINQKLLSLCKIMEINKVPDVFVIESGGLLNAFASRFFGRNFIVLYSEIFELITDKREDELTAVIAHELAHIKRNHLTKQLLILPALWVPFLGSAYSRATEYTCDRIATAYTGNAEATINVLTILAIGKQLAKKVNIPEYLVQSDKETGFFVWLSHVLASHPPTPCRIREIDNFNTYPQLYGYESSRFELQNPLNEITGKSIIKERLYNME